MRIKKNHLQSGAIDASHKIRSSLCDRNRQHDQPETAGAATAQPGAGPELASSGLLLLSAERGR